MNRRPIPAPVPRRYDDPHRAARAGRTTYRTQLRCHVCHAIWYGLAKVRSSQWPCPSCGRDTGVVVNALTSKV